MEEPSTCLPCTPCTHKNRTKQHENITYALNVLPRNSTLFRAGFPWRRHKYGNVQCVGQQVRWLQSNFMSMEMHPLWYLFTSL